MQKSAPQHMTDNDSTGEADVAIDHGASVTAQDISLGGKGVTSSSVDSLRLFGLHQLREKQQLGQV